MPTTTAIRPAALTIHGGTYRYADGTLALSNVDLTVQKGEHLAILGPSGGGKTTLLGLISGRLRVSSGSLATQGNIATIHQDLRLVQQSTVLTNVLHGALPRQRRLRFLPGDIAHAKALLERVGLAEKIHTKVSRLSGGQKQRVAVARALMSDPEILLADEPVASLDSRTAHEVMGLLDRLRLSKGLTLVTVLHDPELAQKFADRTLHLTQSQSIQSSPVPISPPAEVPPPPPPPSSFKLRASSLLILALLAAAYLSSVSSLQLSPRQTQNLLPNLADFARRLIPTPAQILSAPWSQILSSLLETLRMSLLGTTVAILLSLPLSALAARNIAPPVLRFPARFLLNVLRAVPSIVWALLMVAALGLGPVAGIIALAAYSLGYLTKFFYEAFESADANTLSALSELHATPLQKLRYAILPPATPTLAASSIFMFEYNVRAAGILGLVGAGGIGYELKLHLDYGNLHTVGLILALLVALTLALDAASSKLRTRLTRP